MKGEPIFRGAATALITPMNETGVDYDSFGKIIDWQIEQGINALVIAGTSGEGSTLDDAEHKKVIEFAVERIAGRVPMIAGTGSNDTRYAIELSKYACDAGADALLVVTPYYNKATQNGLVAMYEKIAEVSTRPIILYNVPSRTGIGISAQTCSRLADIENIAAIKEASGNISLTAEIAALAGDRLDIYSGNDDMITPVMAVGGIGVISVLSNIMPAKTVEICDRFFAGDTKGSAELQIRLLPLIKALFSEVNPIPAKAAMAAMGFCENYVRLPLTKMEKQHEEILLNLMRKEGLIG